MAVVLDDPRVRVARALAEKLLGGSGDRWRHTIAVAHRARELAVVVGPPGPDVSPRAGGPTGTGDLAGIDDLAGNDDLADRDALVAAAWLHDVGYARPAIDTGFHPLDGARYLDRHGWPPRIVALVAHHSGADAVAAVRGLHGALSRYPHERSPVSDALTYADQTIGPQGQRLPIRERIAEALARHGAGSPQAEAHHVRERDLLAVAKRVEDRLARLPATP